MKKKELLALTPPEMGLHLREIARKDEPQRVNRWVPIKKYQYGRYLLVKEENGYLIVSVFLAEHVRAEAKYPAYVVYFDRKADEFITWEMDTGKWRKSMLDHLDWPEYMYDSGNYISSEDAELIQGYLGTQSGTYEDLLQFQQGVRTRSLRARDKKKTDAWDEAMRLVPALPKDWKTWILKQAVREHYIFYKYQRGGATEGHCTHCGHMVRIRNPKYNQQGVCSRCRQKIRFKSVDKSGYIRTQLETAYLFQRCRPGIVVLRRFEVWMTIEKGDFQNPQIHYDEVKRYLYDGKFQEEVYHFGDFKGRGLRWIGGESDCRWNGFYYKYYIAPREGNVYPRTLPNLERRELRETGLVQWIRKKTVLNPRKYLHAWKRIPVLEQILKAGLPKLTEELVEYPEKLFWREFSGGLAKRLEIDNAKLKRLRELDGGIRFLCWLQEEKKQKLCPSDELICWFIENDILPEDLDFVKDRMSYVQIRNYLTRQQEGQEEDIHQVLITWRDYLSMARRVKMNVHDEIVYRASRLFQRHQELVEYIAENRLSVTAMELAEAYPYINDILPRLSEKYEFSDETYTIRCTIALIRRRNISSVSITRRAISCSCERQSSRISLIIRWK